MTNREFFEPIKNGIMNEEVQEYAANEPLKIKIVEFLTEKNEQILTSVIAEAVGVSTPKAYALCNQLSEDGKIVGEEVIVPKIDKRMVWKIKAEIERPEANTEPKQALSIGAMMIRKMFEAR